MTLIIERIVTALEHQPDAATVRDALLNASFLFEKARGLQQCAWPDEVLQSKVSQEEMRRLQGAVVGYVERNGVGSWALGKCFDPSLKPVLLTVLRRQLQGDAGELFQAMIALDNIGEPVFGGVRSRSILDEEQNRKLAGQYLSIQ